MRHLLLTVSIRMANDGRIETSVAALAQQTGLSRSTVTRILAKASQLGWLMPVTADADLKSGVWQASAPPLPSR